MATINVSGETKEIFKKLKLNLSAKNGEQISEEEFEKILISNFNDEGSLVF